MNRVFGKWALLAALMCGSLCAPVQAHVSLVPDRNNNPRVEEPDPTTDPIPDPPIPGEIIEWFASMGFGDFSWGAIASEMVTAPAFGFPKAGIKIACSKRHR